MQRAPFLQLPLGESRAQCGGAAPPRMNTMRAGGRCASRSGGSRRLVLPPARVLGIPSIFSPASGPAREDKTKDMTASLLQSVIRMAVMTRLKEHAGVQVEVESNTTNIMSGRFGALTVSGQQWRTPMQLTAERLEVTLGEMAVNYSALVLEQRISLRNIPTGTCSITLTAGDLGNFVVHELLKEVVSTAVQGQAFMFDRDSVRFRVDPRTKEGSVYLEGEWAGDDSRYLVKMTPKGMSAKDGALRMVAHRVGDSTMSRSDSGADSSSESEEDAADGFASLSMSDSSHSDMSGRGSEEQIQQKGDAACLGMSDMHGGLCSAENSLVCAAALNHRRNGGSSSSKSGSPVCNASVIEQGLGLFFTELSLNLQGIEVSRPRLAMVLPTEEEEQPSAAQNPLLTITMNLRLLAVPPMDMKF